MLQDFLVFAMGQSIALTTVSTIVKKKTKEYKASNPTSVLPIIEDEENILYKNEYFSVSRDVNSEAIEVEVEKEFPIEIYFLQTSSEASEKLRYQNIIFYFAHIQDVFDSIFKAWYSNFNKLEPFVSVYLGLFYIPKRYMTDRFLSLSQSVEAFHRIMFGGNYISEEDYKQGVYQDLVDAIDADGNPHSLSSEFKSALKGRLGYMYEFSLRKRLKEILRSHELCFPDGFLKTSQQRNNFVGAVTEVRNILTHLDEGRDINSVIEPKELRRLSKYLEAVLTACIMKYLEIKEKTIKRSIENVLNRS